MEAMLCSCSSVPRLWACAGASRKRHTFPQLQKLGLYTNRERLISPILPATLFFFLEYQLLCWISNAASLFVPMFTLTVPKQALASFEECWCQHQQGPSSRQLHTVNPRKQKAWPGVASYDVLCMRPATASTNGIFACEEWYRGGSSPDTANNSRNQK